jgi:hypothetical protein
MTAAVDTAATPPAEMPQGAKAITLPAMVVEGLETSDRRYIEPGALSTRSLPITLYAQTRSTHGADGDAATWVVGAITEAERLPGPQVIQKSTGEPFPEGTFVWTARGWMYPDVPAAPQKSAYEMLRDGALSGNSVDLSAVEAEFEYADGAGPQDPPERIVTYKAAIAATTLVGQPAFPDAYAQVDDEPMAADTVALAASGGVPAWRAGEIGDVCSPCALGHTLTADAAPDTATLAVEDMPNATQDYSTSGMIALVPANPNMLRVPGGDSADQLHLTLAYLGDQVDEWEPEQVVAIHRIAREATDWNAYVERILREAEERGETAPGIDRNYRQPAQRGPVVGNIFAHSVFNPNGDNGHAPATVYLLDGTGDREAIDQLAHEMGYQIRDAIGSAMAPEQHRPFVPHVTAGYGLAVSQLTYTGPVEFTHLRVAIGDNVTDYPLGGGDGTLVASAATLPPAEWFADPRLPAYTPVTVTEEGRVYGHIASWNTCHIGFPGQCIQPPRSPSGYAYFRVHPIRARGADGKAVTLPVGYGTISQRPGVEGHASTALSATDAARHYDNTCHAAFELSAGEDDHGIWVAGRLMPGLDELTEHKARSVTFSGDWRTIGGELEMVAALAVNTPGFPAPRVRVASGEPLALVAAGIVAEPVERQRDHGVRATPADPALAEVLDWVRGQRAAQEHAAAVATLTEALGEGFTVTELAEAELAFTLDAGHPWLEAELDEDYSAAADIGDYAKTLRLPPYIKRIANHLKKKGMAQGHAIASAVNAAKKMCRTGDLNFPGSQQVNAGSKAEACAAVAQWKADRPNAK